MRPHRSFRDSSTLPALALALALTPNLRAQLSESEMQQLESRLPSPTQSSVEFERDIRPIFEGSCLQCHGPERPKGRFRLTSREAALQGGSNGVDIIPGQSARSPLIYYTARLVEDMEMPPPGKGEPLTTEQIALLRSWIDQGAAWETTQPPQFLFALTPSIQWFAVKDNEQQFREHTGIKEGWNGGFQSLYFQEQLAPGRTLTFEGQTFLNPEQYRFRLAVEQRDRGFLKLGFEQYREFYSDAGGFDPTLSLAPFSLGEDLHLDIGRAWASFGITIPDRPRLVFGYELRYREGAKSTLQWGDAGPDRLSADRKRIFPASKSIDEKLHRVTFDLTHSINGVGVENNFAAEFYDNQTARKNADLFNTTSGTLEKYFNPEERHEHFQASDAFRLEKQVRDWLFLSGGYYFSRLEGEYSFQNQTIAPGGMFNFSDNFWLADSILLEQDTHIFNANTQLGPWGGLTLFGGLQSEWMTQRGFGAVSLDQGIPGAIFPQPATVDADLDRSSFQEHIGFRYTKIPFTVLFGEGRFAQENLGQSEDHLGGGYEFLCDTDASTDLYDARAGLTISPWTQVSFTAQYKYRSRAAEYDHLRDQQFGEPNQGYSAFITSRDTETDELSLKLTFRPASWLKTALTWQKIATDYTTGTDAYILPELAVPGFPSFPERVFAPGGVLYAGEYDAEIYGALVELRPSQRLRLSSIFTFRNSRTTTSHNLSPVLVDYEGDVYSSFSSASFVLNSKTDLFSTYNYSWADYGQNNFSGGLPLGLVYNWHILTAGISRQWKENIATSLQYRFYRYDQDQSGGAQDYTAHGLLASLSISLR